MIMSRQLILSLAQLIMKRGLDLFAKTRIWVQTHQIVHRNRYRWLKYFAASSIFLGVQGVFMTCTDFGRENNQKIISNTMGFLSKIQIPFSFRKYVYGKYAQKYGVNLQEIDRDLQQYRNFSEFFTRKIKQRPQKAEAIKNPNSILSPCDGQIISITEVLKDENLIVKQVSYSISKLLFDRKMQSLIQQLKFNPENKIYQVIVYLSPGEYHRLHAPNDMQIKIKQSIKGRLRSVSVAQILRFGKIVYQNNARKILQGSYINKKTGYPSFIGLALIGALNVGDIILYDKIQYKKGQQIGYFNLGSTVVMFVQLPTLNKTLLKNGDYVKFGQPIFQIF